MGKWELNMSFTIKIYRHKTSPTFLNITSEMTADAVKSAAMIIIMIPTGILLLRPVRDEIQPLWNNKKYNQANKSMHTLTKITKQLTHIQLLWARQCSSSLYVLTHLISHDKIMLFLISIFTDEELSHRDIQYLPKVTQLINGIVWIQIQIPNSSLKCVQPDFIFFKPVSSLLLSFKLHFKFCLIMEYLQTM